MKLLLEKHFSGAPVVYELGRLVGMLSKYDCFRAALNACFHQEWGGVVGNCMSRNVEALDADLDLVTAAERFPASAHRRFPVMEDDRMIGQINRADLLRPLADHWHKVVPVTRSTLKLSRSGAWSSYSEEIGVGICSVAQFSSHRPMNLHNPRCSRLKVEAH